MKTMMTQPQEWWGSLSNGERRLIWSVMKLLRGAKRSDVEEVARAAAKWESGIGCFIKLRLMNTAPKAGRPARQVGTWTISSPSAAHSRRYAAPGPR